MQKTKLGISVGLLAAMVCGAALFSGYTVLILVAGYVLICEEDEWLKKTTIKAVLTWGLFSLAFTLIGLIPDVLAWVSTVLSVVGVSFYYGIVNNILNIFTYALDVLRTVVFLLLGYKALSQKTLEIPVIDKILNKVL